MPNKGDDEELDADYHENMSDDLLRDTDLRNHESADEGEVELEAEDDEVEYIPLSLEELLALQRLNLNKLRE